SEAAIASKPAWVKFASSALTNIADDTAPASGQWSWDTANERVILNSGNNPTANPVSYTMSDGDETVCVTLYDGCDNVLGNNSSWGNSVVSLTLSEVPNAVVGSTGMDITSNDPLAGEKGFRTGTITDPAGADFAPPDQTLVKGELDDGKACVVLTAVSEPTMSPATDPKTPIKITPAFFGTPAAQETGGTNRPGYVLIRPGPGLPSTGTTVLGFATITPIFQPYPDTATQAIVLSPAWSKSGGKIAFVSRQTSPCGCTTDCGDTPYDEFNVYTMEYSAATWTNCMRLTKNALDASSPIGASPWSEVTWAPSNDKLIFAGIEALNTGVEKLFWVSATGEVGASTGTQANVPPSDPNPTTYFLSADVTAPTDTIYLTAAPAFGAGSYVTVTDFVNAETRKVAGVSGTTVTLTSNLLNNYLSFDVVNSPASLYDMSQMITPATDFSSWGDPDWSPDDADCDADGAKYRDKLTAVRWPSDPTEDFEGTAASGYTDGPNAFENDSPNVVYFTGSKDADGVYRLGVSNIYKVTNFTGYNPRPLKPRWAPDCSKIAFLAWDTSPIPNNPPPPSKTSVYIINLTDTSLGATATLPISSLTATGTYKVYDYATYSMPAYYPNWSADGKVVSYSLDINNILDITEFGFGFGYDTIVNQVFGSADFDNYLEYVMDQSDTSGAIISPQLIGRASYNELGLVQCPGNLSGSSCPNPPNFPFTYVAQTSANTGSLRMISLQDESYINQYGGLLFQNGIVTAVFPPGTVASDTVFYNTWPTPYCTGAAADEFSGGDAGVCADSPESNFIVVSGEAREFFPDGTNFTSYVRLIFHYCDNDNDGFVDAQTEGRSSGFTFDPVTSQCDVGGVPTSGGTVDVNTLAVFYWDETNNKWVQLTGVINKTEKTITVFSSHFSRFDTLGFRYGYQPAGPIVVLNLYNVHTYPNPWLSTMRPRNIVFSADGVQVDPNHTVSVTVHIYNIRGSLVRTIHRPSVPAAQLTAPDPGSTHHTAYIVAEWDGRNNAGRDVASGIYLYILQATDDQNSTSVTVKGKLSVIH
ncbi:MAG: hypothetical protein AB1742_06385, partial [bacterium]